MALPRGRPHGRPLAFEGAVHRRQAGVDIGPGSERWLMTIEETNKVDIISAYPGGGVVYLSLVGHLPWSDAQGGAISVEEHLYLLQEKLNAYLER